jgi:hypothetical protein
MLLENFREKLGKLIIGEKTVVSKYKIGEKVGYLCHSCDNTTFVVINYNKMKCVRCGYETALP